MAIGPDQVLLAAIFTAGAALLTYGLVALVQLLRLRRTGDGWTAEPPSGFLSLEGTVSVPEGGDLVTSPVTGTAACWYDYTVDRRGDDMTRPDWEAVTSSTEGSPFVVDGASGRFVGVDPAGAVVDLPPATETTFAVDPDGDPDDLPAALAADLAEDDTGSGTHGEAGPVDVDVESLAPGEHYRLVERRLSPGNAVAVTGAARATSTGPGATAVLRTTADGGRLRRLFATPLVVASPDADGARGVLRDRALVGLVFGLPLVMLSTVFAFPPPGV